MTTNQKIYDALLILKKKIDNMEKNINEIENISDKEDKLDRIIEFFNNLDKEFGNEKKKK